MAKKHKLLITKLAVFIVLVAGFSLLIPGGKVSAVTCPGPNSLYTDDLDWGVKDSGLANHFASVVVAAYRADTGEKLNVQYRMNSSVDPNYSYGPAPIGEGGTKVPASLWPDARIFKVHVQGNVIQADARYKQRWFETGGTLSAPASSCTGWDVLGPGTTRYNGNGFMLDCQEVGTDGNRHNNRFWIDSISTPGGAAGANGGHWSIEASSGGEGLTDRGYPMNGTSSWLSVRNGENARMHLIWHPNPPPKNCITNPEMPQCQTQRDADCTNAFIENTSTAGGNRKRTHVEISRITVNKNGNHSPDYDVHNNIENPDAKPGGPYGNIDQFVPSSGGEDDNDVTTGKKWWYQPESNTIHIKITVEGFWDNTGDGVNNPSWNYINTVRDADVPCFAAHCDMSVYGDGPGGIIIAGGTMHFRGTFYNDSPPPDYLTLWWPGVKDQNGGQHGVGVEQVLAGGGGYPFSFDIAAPGSITEQDWSFYPVYFNADRIGPDCNAHVKTFRPFNLTPSVEVRMTPTVEDPTAVTYIGYANTTFSDPYYPSGFKVHYDADSQQTRFGSSTSHLNTVNYGFGNVNTPYTYGPIDPRPNHAGDEYCLNNFFVYETSGFIGPNNEFAYTNSDFPPQSACQHVFDRPYFNLYGADAVSGSVFRNGDTCTPGPNQTIRAYRSTSKGGSGAQFAALALDQISGFRSASVSSADATALTFANTDAADKTGTLGDDQSKDGGKYNGDTVCSQDFYATMKDPADVVSAAGSVNINTSGDLQDKKQTFFNRGGGNLIVTSNGINYNKQTVVYVDGDVIINKNLSFQPGKYLAIIAKGNIYIDKSVTRLDGMYVAQPRDDGSKGNIYTCANGTVPYGVLDLYDNCHSQLVVNGAFAANSIKLLRVANSLRDSTNHEKPTNLNTGTGTKAAEVFNFSPELYMYTPVFYDVSVSQPYQYLTTLPTRL